MKQIPNYPNYYLTENGEVISKRTKREKKLTQHLDKFGYLRVGLMTPDNKCKTERIHRLMMETYGNPPPDDMIDPTVDHINGNKLDNRIKNLQWLSNRDNSYKGIKDTIKTYILELPTGELITVTNLNRWCKEYNINPSSIRKAYRLNHKYKGYRIIKKID